MHVYLPEKCRSPFLHGVLIFSKVGVSDSKLWWLFSLLLTRVISYDFDHLEGLDIVILIYPPPLYLKSCQFCPIISQKGNHGASLTRSFWLPSNLIMPPSIQIRFGDEDMWKKVWLFTRSCFHVEFLEFQSYSRYRNHFDIDSKQTHSTEIQVIPMERFSEVMKTFCFNFWWKIWSDIWLVTKGWNFNLRVNENRVSTKMWRTRSDIWLVTKRFKFQFEG